MPSADHGGRGKNSIGEPAHDEKTNITDTAHGAASRASTYISTWLVRLPKSSFRLWRAFEEMARHLRGEIELKAHDLPGGTMTPAQIKAIRSKVASSTKEFERLFGIPARTMESYEQGRRGLDGAMRALLRIIDREPNAARRALAP